MGTSRKGTKHHSAKVVAQAMALLIAGASVEEVSTQLDIPNQTISDWRKELPEVGQGRAKTETIADLMTEYLDSCVRANIAQLKVFSDENWVKSQTAGDLAILHGVLFDKAVRVWDAAKRGAEQQALLNAAPTD